MNAIYTEKKPMVLFYRKVLLNVPNEKSQRRLAIEFINDTCENEVKREFKNAVNSAKTDEEIRHILAELRTILYGN